MTFGGKGTKICWEGVYWGGGIFQGRGGGGMSELLAGGIGRDSLSIPSCYIPFDLKFYVDYEC